MTANNGVPPDALTQLRSEHAHLAALLGEVAREPNAARAHGLFRTLHEELNAHRVAEEAVFYAALSAAASAADPVQRAVAAHGTIGGLADELLTMTAVAPPWRERMRALQLAIAAHVDDEEGELFAIAGRELGGDALRALGAQLRDAAARWRAAECAGAHAAAATAPAR